MRRAVAIACAACLIPHAVAADACAPLDALDAFLTQQDPPRDATCATYLTEAGTTGTSCHWSFSFRDPIAKDEAAQIWAALATCRPNGTSASDQPVNHPDSYDLRAWRTEAATYAISVKDKGALNRTLVFLRVEPN